MNVSRSTVVSAGDVFISRHWPTSVRYVICEGGREEGEGEEEGRREGEEEGEGKSDKAYQNAILTDKHTHTQNTISLNQ